MSEPCPKCGAKRTLFEGQTSWECGSYRRVLGGPDICTVQVEFTEGEHCKTKQALEAAKRRIAELENEVQNTEAAIRKMLPDFNCRMFEPYYKLLKDLLPD